MGECGLDETYYERGAPKEDQVRIFRDHIQLAKTRQLPLVVHVRGKEAQVLKEASSIIKEELVSRRSISALLMIRPFENLFMPHATLRFVMQPVFIS